ncbi:MAG: tetratricopeptide repeat protein [Thermoleophilia bacterium]
MSEVGAYEHFQRGMELLASRDFHQAAVALESAKRLEPDKASIREALGRAYLSVREYAKAVEEFEVVAEIAPTDHYAQYCLGRAYRGLGDGDRAARAFELARCFGSPLVR